MRDIFSDSLDRCLDLPYVAARDGPLEVGSGCLQPTRRHVGGHSFERVCLGAKFRKVSRIDRPTDAAN